MKTYTMKIRRKWERELGDRQGEVLAEWEFQTDDLEGLNAVLDFIVVPTRLELYVTEKVELFRRSEPVSVPAGGDS